MINRIASLEKLLNVIINDYKEGVIVLDPEANIIKINNTALKMLGMVEPDALGKHITQVLHLFSGGNEISAEHLCPPNQIEVEGEYFKKENLRVVNKAEISHLANITAKTITRDANTEIGSIVLIENVEDKAEFERMKLDFTSMSIHILRTPITIIRGYLQLLIRPETIAKLEQNEIDAVNECVRAAEDIKDRVENLFSMSQVDKGAIKVNMIELSIDNTVKQVATNYIGQAKEKGLEIKILPAREPLTLVKADILKIQDVIGRLIDNAVNFTESGFIEISFEQLPEGVRVNFKDTGVGISEKNIEHVFGKFFRIKSALEMKTGSGLGLYIAKKYVEAMDGKIGVASKEGVGSIFWFELKTSQKPTER